MPVALKKIVVENFKSFNGETTIDLLHPFIAVIGPNGSGKSNFMDAISFVMGEKTNKLRVKRLGELIHGAPIGKPVANSASVTAVFASENGSDVTFKRFVRSSSCEYRIDNSVVSGQEYLDGLYALGVNARANNFLVFQGSVEEIVLANSGTLAALFEEISESGKLKPEYDRLKAEKLQADKAAQFAYQKKKGMAAYRKEAKVEKQEAQKFQRLRNECMKKNIELQLFRLYQIEKRMAKFVEEQEKKDQELEKMENEKETLEEEFREKKKESGVLSRQLAKLEQDSREAEVTGSKMKPKFIKTKENVAYLQRKVDNARKSLEEARRADDVHKSVIKDLEEELAQIESARAAYEDRVVGQSQIGTSCNVTLEATQIHEYNRLKEVAANESAKYLQSLESITREQKCDQDKLDNELRKKTEIDNKLKQKRHAQVELEKRLERIEEHVKTTETTLEALTKQRDELESVIVDSKDKVQRLQQEIEDIAADLGNATLDKHELLRLRKKNDVVENLQALYPGVRDRILNLCRPIHKRYYVAVTKVLGKNMDAIVVDTEKTARDCIQYLKAGLIEPETFLPLDYIRPKPLKERLRTIENPANVRLVYDVLQIADQSIERAILYATKSTLVCENAEDARKVAYDIDPNARYDCVALDGTYFHRNGIISGGAFDLQRKAKRWDEKQVAQLKIRKDQLTEELRESLMTSRREHELNIIQSKMKNHETLLRFSKNEVVDTKKNLDQLKVDMENLQSERENLELAIAAIETTMAQRNEEIQRIKSIIDVLEDTTFEDFCNQIGVSNIRQYEERGLLSQQERDRRRMDFDNQYNRILTQLDFERKRETESKITRWLNVMEDAEAKLELAKQAEIDLKAEMANDEAKRKELEARVNAKRMEVSQREEELSKWRSALKAKAKDILKVQRSLSTIETSIEKQKAERHEILTKCKMEDIQIPVLEGNLEDVSIEGDTTNGDEDTTQQQYQLENDIRIDYDGLPDELKEIEEGPEVDRAIGNLKKTMKELNSAIEQIRAPNMKNFEKASERFCLAAEKFQETTGEFEDACRKAKKITAQFDKVKKARYDRFTHAFDHVSQEIDNIYKGLLKSQSAQAYMEAENPEEPYLGGIKFNCVPPGKRFQVMSNLSGGEKTVAALAFLFALNSIRPSPFFVLDEIDAALDNANISRVANYIREKSTSIQMIIISLKLQFYSKADALVGICPDIGEGIKSEVLSVDLTEYDP